MVDGDISAERNMLTEKKITVFKTRIYYHGDTFAIADYWISLVHKGELPQSISLALHMLSHCSIGCRNACFSIWF